MPNALVKVYDLDMKLTAMLENAYGIGYQMPLNSLWTAAFSLPANDPKNAECKPLHYVELFDGDVRVELFRIIPNTAKRDNSGLTVTYQCEHVLATLLDDILFQYHTVGNLGVYTSDVLQYILSKQIVQRWNLGTMAFGREFEYTWQNETLLGAVFSVPKPFVEEYQWTWNTEVFPWQLNLIAPAQPDNDENMAYIRYGINMQGIEKTTDPMSLCTRLYCLGYGEGVNQLTISDINGGLPYLDADTQAQYGIVSRTFVDRRYDNAETLKARGQVLLEELKQPRVTYKVSASEIYRLTGQQIYKFLTGSHVRTIDEEMGEDFIARVVNVSKSDITGAPGDAEIEIANRPEDIANSIADLENRQRIHEVYAQGSTNIDSHDFADNADPQHPAILRLYIPEETARINKVQLSYQVGPFRGYSQGAASGGGTVTSTSSGGGSSPTTSTQPTQTPTTTVESAKIESSATSGSWDQFAIEIPDATGPNGLHNHGIDDGIVLVDKDGGWHTFQESGYHSHSLTSDHRHDVTIPAHSHSVAIPGHNHTVTIPEHSHEVTVPEHSHAMVYGIFEGPTPTSLTVQIDGTTVPGLGTNVQDVDIIPFLSKDSGGKVSRGWHEIKITPNDLGRIVANVNIQLFVQSRGGGNY